ncbi:MAG: hypothetical protein SYR96_36120 [Actinomycetota bacterium]|nr:hypothetical protein [Actinomycetota bacterium]
MTRAISRDSFQELKNYLGVHFQQGRPILDADLNEAQAVLLSLLRRLTRETLGDGSPNSGFAVEGLYPPPLQVLIDHLAVTGGDLFAPESEDCYVNALDLMLQLFFDKILYFLTVPGDLLENFEEGGFVLSSPQGSARVSRDRPLSGEGFLRVSGHAGTVTVFRELDTPVDLSSKELVTFRFRLNREVAGRVRFFMVDADGNRSVWDHGNPAFAADTWLAGVASPLELRLHIRTPQLPDAFFDPAPEPDQTQGYSTFISAFGGTTPLTWSASGDLPPGFGIQPTLGVIDMLDNEPDSPEDLANSPLAVISCGLERPGTYTFDVTVTDALQRTATKTMTLTVREGEPDFSAFLFHALFEQYGQVGTAVTTDGEPADLTTISGYGFELYQDPEQPLVWDLDDLRTGSAELQHETAANNFLIRGSDFGNLLRRMTLVSALMESGNLPTGGLPDAGEGGPAPDELPELDQILDLLNTELQLTESSVDTAGRYYVAGLPCVQVDDVLYSDQADPNDEELTPPGPGEIRHDTVYLDAWTEPVTFVQDPAIREVALGGPDTSTRERVRHRVRVAQGGTTPTGDGTGFGRMSTEGTYTAEANRLYLVEIDRPGDIGTATFRWSQENAAVVARVIEPVPPKSTVVTVEDASAFHPGDLILLRKEFGAERHTVHQVTGNQITLAEPTGAQLARLRGANRPGFDTFSMADRPMVQRWDGFGVPIVADTDDETVSAATPLSDGVLVRFSGDRMLAGDYWSFTTRHLAADDPDGGDTHIERLDFARPQGVRHHYATLAVITRNGDDPEPDHIYQIADRRTLAGNAQTLTRPLRDLPAFVGDENVHLGGMRLQPASFGSKFAVFFSGDLHLHGTGDETLVLTASFYNDQMTDPELDPDAGKIQDRERIVELGHRPAGVDIALRELFVNSDLRGDFMPPSRMIPTEVHFFVRFESKDNLTPDEQHEFTFSAGLHDMNATVLELMKSR